jgi:glycosyltransferase involved in cell wall biosynthesis
MLEQPQRIAVVHEWFTSMRGGEKCVEALCEVFPQATLFALSHVTGSVSSTIEQMPLRTSFIQHLPLAEKRYRYYLPLFPTAVQRFAMDEFDLVVSSNHCVAKGVRTSRRTLHICYCHSPMRYIWDLYDDYFGKGHAGLLTRMGMAVVRPYLRRWDIRTSSNPHHFVANSANVQRRIKQIYNRSSDVIYPPVNTSVFQLSSRDDGYFLVVSAFVPYKRIDLAIRAFNIMGEKLVIVGDGPDAAQLRNLAGRTIDFVGWQPDERLRDFYARCTAVVFPGEEDFGIVPVEAMASGKPVIAYARGGALETVVDTSEMKTGVLFREQTTDALIEAVRRCRKTTFDPGTLRRHALTFDREIFKRRMNDYIMEKWREFSPDSINDTR